MLVFYDEWRRHTTSVLTASEHRNTQESLMVCKNSHSGNKCRIFGGANQDFIG
jgi:hypothetical protein